MHSPRSPSHNNGLLLRGGRDEDGKGTRKVKVSRVNIGYRAADMSSDYHVITALASIILRLHAYLARDQRE